MILTLIASLLNQLNHIIYYLLPKSSSPKLIKDTIYDISEPLTHIINRSIISGLVPNQLKVAKVILMYKASNQDQLENYRPRSLLPAFSFF